MILNTLKAHNAQLAERTKDLEKLKTTVLRVIEATGIERDNPSGDLADDLANVMQAFISQYQNDLWECTKERDEQQRLSQELDAARDAVATVQGTRA